MTDCNENIRSFHLPVCILPSLNEYCVALLIFLSLYQLDHEKFVGYLKEIEDFYHFKTSKTFRNGIKEAAFELSNKDLIRYCERSNVFTMELTYPDGMKLIEFKEADFEKIRLTINQMKEGSGKAKTRNSIKPLMHTIKVYCCWKESFGDTELFTNKKLANMLNISEYSVSQAMKVLNGLEINGSLLEKERIYQYRDVYNVYTKEVKLRPWCIGSAMIETANAFSETDDYWLDMDKQIKMNRIYSKLYEDEDEKQESEEIDYELPF